MKIQWRKHSKDKFLERVLLHGINYGDIEFEIKSQKVKIPQEDNKIKTIFPIGDLYFTIIKKEGKNFINIITIWDSSKKEVNLWQKKKNAFHVEEKAY